MHQSRMNWNKKNRPFETCIYVIVKSELDKGSTMKLYLCISGELTGTFKTPEMHIEGSVGVPYSRITRRACNATVALEYTATAGN